MIYNHLYFSDENGSIKWLFEDVIVVWLFIHLRRGLIAWELVKGQPTGMKMGKTASFNLLQAPRQASNLLSFSLFLERTVRPSALESELPSSHAQPLSLQLSGMKSVPRASQQPHDRNRGECGKRSHCPPSSSFLPAIKKQQELLLLVLCLSLFLVSASITSFSHPRKVMWSVPAMVWFQGSWKDNRIFLPRLVSSYADP